MGLSKHRLGVWSFALQPCAQRRSHPSSMQLYIANRGSSTARHTPLSHAIAARVVPTMSGVRQMVLRVGETLSPTALATSLGLTAAMFGLGYWMQPARKQGGLKPGLNPTHDVLAVPLAEAAASGDVGEQEEEVKANPVKHPPIKEPRPEGDRSEHVPDVYIAVYDSFEELALTGEDAVGKDVLLQVFQNGCPACGALSPRTRMVAQLARQQGFSDKVKVVMMNSSTNTPLPPPLEPPKGTPLAVPFIAIFPKGAKDEPLKMRMLEKQEGGRTGIPAVPDILEFIESASGTGFRVSPDIRKAADAMEAEAHAMTYHCVHAGALELWMHMMATDGSKRRKRLTRACQRLQAAVELPFEACEKATAAGRLSLVRDAVRETHEPLMGVIKAVNVKPGARWLKPRIETDLEAERGKPQSDLGSVIGGLAYLSMMASRALYLDPEPECRWREDEAVVSRIALAGATLVHRHEQARAAAKISSTER